MPRQTLAVIALGAALTSLVYAQSSRPLTDAQIDEAIALGPGRSAVWEAFFDRLPESEFDVVVATSDGAQRYNVDGKARQKIR